MIAGVVLHKFGRKIPLIVSVIADFLGFIVLGTSMFHEMPEVMIAARVVLGMTVGMLMPAATIYVSCQ